VGSLPPVICWHCWPAIAMIGCRCNCACYSVDASAVCVPIRSKFRPVSPWLIRAYLASPIKPLAKQMLIRAGVSHSGRQKTGAV